jgi:hypothetical protein
MPRWSNPGNDASAMAGLFRPGRFHASMRASTPRGSTCWRRSSASAQAIKPPEIKLAVFYYAGHGVQLDWRNYLLPVDAEVALGRHEAALRRPRPACSGSSARFRDKTFVIILDACRNNPFGERLSAGAEGPLAIRRAGRQPDRLRHLARQCRLRRRQEERPVHREPGARAVPARHAHRGRPEARAPQRAPGLARHAGSLGDHLAGGRRLHFQRRGPKKLSESELEQLLLEDDIAEWGRIKSSKNIEDWVGYLREFPNGRFAEIAQTRLARLLAEDEKLAAEKRQREEEQRLEQERIAEQQRLATERRQLEEHQLKEARRREEEQKRLSENQRLERERKSIAAAAQLAASQTPSPATATSSAAGPRPAPSAKDAGKPALDIRAGVAVPLLIAPSANPFSAGRYPLGRIYTVGDRATFRQTDILTGIEERTYSPRVTRVDYEQDRVEFNNGNIISDLMGNTLKNGAVEFDSPVQFIPAEFQVGKKWTAAFRRTQNDKTTNAYYDMQIVKRETISVPAGSFDTFLIEGNGWNTTVSSRLEARLWLVPGVNFAIRRELVSRNQRGGFRQTERHELVSLRQQVIGSL